MYEGQELNHAFGLCHYKQFLFWNEYRGGSIYKLDQVTKTVTLLRNERPPIFEIRVYDAHQQQGVVSLTGVKKRETDTLIIHMCNNIHPLCV